MTLPTAITNLVTLVGSISGVKQATSQVPESANAFPFAIVYPGSGNLEPQNYGWGKFFHVLVVDYYANRSNLPTAIGLIPTFVEALAAKLIADPSLSGAISEMTGIRYTFQSTMYGEIETIGCKVEISVKIIESA